MRKTFLQTHYSCSMQKTARKTSLYSKNESILKMAKNGHNARAIAHAKYSVWVKKLNCLKHTKNVSTNTLQLFYAKNGSKKQLIFEKWEHFENGHNARARAHAKYSVWVRKQNCLKHAKNVSTNTLKLFYAKNGSKKQLIFEKWEHFENCQKWSQCKGYSPCKILSLGQKIKLPKTCEKRFYKHITVVLCKKRLEKTANIRKMRAFWKLPKMVTMQRL